VLEQLGNGLKSHESRQQFYHDFVRMDNIVRQKSWFRNGEGQNDFLPLQQFENPPVPEDELLFHQQRELSQILESGLPYSEAIQALSASSLAHTAWNIEHWDPAMLETAMQIARKWKKQV
jgi:hypothetical protein